MASKMKHQCNQIGCSMLTINRLCDKHQKLVNQKYESQRLSSFERGYNAEWRKERLEYLKHNPFCLDCLKNNKHEPATVVDHIIPHKGNRLLFWDKKNWQPLCKRHHDIKTMTKDGRWGNAVH